QGVQRPTHNGHVVRLRRELELEPARDRKHHLETCPAARIANRRFGAACAGNVETMASSRQLEAAKLNVRAARRTGRRSSPSAIPPQDSRRGSHARDLNEARRP